MTVAAASSIVAIERINKNLAHLGWKPEIGGSEATYVELLPRHSNRSKYEIACTGSQLFPRLRVSIRLSRLPVP